MEENKQEISKEEIAKRFFYYSKPFIIYNMLSFAKGRETCFLVKNSYKSNIRYLNAGAIEIFYKFLGIQTNTEKDNGEEAKDPFRFFSPEKNYSIYSSLAKINWLECPIKAFSYALKERSKQQELIKEDISDYITDFTAGIDFDGDLKYEIIKGKEKPIHLEISREEAVHRALEDLKIIIPIFNEYKIEWFCQFSGSRGFHIFYEIPLDISVQQKIDLSNKISRTFADTFDLQTLDRTKNTLRKVFKTSYSLVTTDNITRVVLPLSDKEIEEFSLDKMEVEYVYNNVRGLKNRGLLWRNQNVSYLEKQKRFKKFLKDYEIEISKEDKK